MISPASKIYKWKKRFAQSKTRSAPAYCQATAFFVYIRVIELVMDAHRELVLSPFSGERCLSA
jgi:hypothetical protein